MRFAKAAADAQGKCGEGVEMQSVAGSRAHSTRTPSTTSAPALAAASTAAAGSVASAPDFKAAGGWPTSEGVGSTGVDGTGTLKGGGMFEYSTTMTILPLSYAA